MAAARQNHWFDNDVTRINTYLRHILRRSVYANSAGFEDNDAFSQLENLIAQEIPDATGMNSFIFRQTVKRVIVDEPAECISDNKMPTLVE